MERRSPWPPLPPEGAWMGGSNLKLADCWGPEDCTPEGAMPVSSSATSFKNVTRHLLSLLASCREQEQAIVWAHQRSPGPCSMPSCCYEE